MNIVGIDTGLHGALSCIFEDGRVNIKDTPIYKIKKGKRIKTQYDLKIMSRYLKNVIPCTVYLEKSQAFPGQGACSTWNTGYGFGLWVGILTALKIPYEIVSPKTWQKEFFVGKAGETKALAYKVASALFPNVELKTPRGRLLDGRADALLLSEFGKRKQKGIQE